MVLFLARLRPIYSNQVVLFYVRSAASQTESDETPAIKDHWNDHRTCGQALGMPTKDPSACPGNFPGQRLMTSFAIILSIPCENTHHISPTSTLSIVRLINQPTKWTCTKCSLNSKPCVGQNDCNDLNISHRTQMFAHTRCFDPNQGSIHSTLCGMSCG